MATAFEESALVRAQSQWQNEVRQTVARYLSALFRESFDELGSVLGKEALVVDASGEVLDRALSLWQARFRKYEFRRSLKSGHLRDFQLSLFTSEQSVSLRALRELNLSVPDSGVLAVLKFPASGQASPNGSVDSVLWPRRLELVLQATAQGWKILKVYEEHSHDR